MARVTGAEVKEVIKTALTSDEIAAMLTAANLLVTAKCASAGYSATELKEIERWLAAHFVAGRDQSGSLKSKTVGEASETYQTADRGVDSSTLESSPYGQRALLLDYRGCLTNLGKKVATLRPFGPVHGDFSSEEVS